MKKSLLLIASLFGCLTADAADDKPVFQDQKQKISYIIGSNLGNTWKKQDIEVDMDFLIRGLKDAQSGSPLAMTEEEMKAVMTAFQEEFRGKQAEKAKQLAAKNLTEGAAFLAENKTKEGVVTLPSGLQYKIIQKGDGPKPSSSDTIVAHYRGTLLDGTEFDSSYKRGGPMTRAVTGVIPGWTEALLLMPTGSKWQLFIPAALAYQERGAGGQIGPNAALIFDIELLSIKPPTPPANPSEPVTSDIIKVPSAEELKKGAKIEIIKPDQIKK